MVVRDLPLEIYASDDASVVMQGGPGDTLYYKSSPSVSSSSYDGTLTIGQNVTLTSRTWIVSSGRTRVFFSDINQLHDTTNVHGITDTTNLAALSGTASSAIGRSILATASASTARGLVGGPIILDAKADYGAKGDGATVDTAALNSAITAFNASSGRVVLYLPTGDYKIDGPLTTVTKSDGAIVGAGPGATRVQLSDGAGNFFTFGSTSAGISRVLVSDMHLQATGSPSTAHAIQAVDMDDSIIQNVRVQDVAGLIQMGSVGNAATCQRTVLRNVSGTILDGSTKDWIRIYGANGSKFFGCHLTSGICATGTSAYVSLGDTVGVTDTLTFDECVFFANPGAGGTTGKPYGFYIDATAQAVNNLWVTNGTFDGTHVAAYYFRGDAGVTTARNHQFKGNRMETAAGAVIDFSHASSGTNTNPAQMFKFQNNSFFFGNGGNTTTPVTFAGSKVSGVHIEGNDWFEEGTGTKSRVFLMGISDWTATDNHVRKLSHSSTAIDSNYAFETSADVDRFNTSGNIVHAPTGGYLANTRGYFKHFAYAANSKERRVRDFFNGAQVRYGDQVGGVIASTTVTQFQHYYNLIRIEEVARLTGIVARTGATSNGNLKVALWDKAGALLASSGSTAAAAINTVNEVAFTTAAVVNPGDYLISIMSDSATEELLMARRHWPYGSTVEGSFTLPASVTPPTTEPTALTPLLSVY